MTKENQIVKADKPQLALQPGGVKFADMDQLYRFSEAIVQARMTPSGIDTPQKVMLVLEHGMEHNVPPMKALQCSMIVNNRVAFFGDMPLALVRQSGKMKEFGEFTEGEGDNMEAFCRSWRNDSTDVCITSFSVADAKKAKLWGKSGPWSQYPDRMLKYRARSFNLRDNFPDVLMGLTIAEEYEGVDTVEYKTDETAPQTTPRDERTADEPVTRTVEMAAHELYQRFDFLWTVPDKEVEALCGLLVLANGGKVSDYENPETWTVAQSDAALDLIRHGKIPGEIIALYPPDMPDPEPEPTEEIAEELEAEKPKEDLFDGEKTEQN